MSLRLVDNHHIDMWAGSIGAQSSFPYWVRRLIQAVVNPKKLRMPHGDSVWIPGFDGVIEAESRSPFVPDGLSVWEIGVTEGYRGKAQEDYDKRLNDPVDKDGKKKISIDRSATAFVFVTPWIWKDKDQWERDRKAEAVWADVRVIDGEDLNNWLESAPAVALQFAAEIGLVPPDGLWTVDQAWDDWCLLSDPPISEEFVTAGRADQEAEFLRRLAEPPDTMTIRADSPREAWGFALATIRRIQAEVDRENVTSRTLVVDDPAVFKRVRNLANLVLVLKEAREPVSGAVAKGGCHVVLPEGNDYSAQRNVIVLGRPTFRQATDAISKMLSGNVRGDQVLIQAERSARACGLSVTIYQRLNAHANTGRPTWAERAEALPLLPALLAGRWDARNKADQQILSLLAECGHEQIMDDLTRFLSVDEPPLRKVDQMWTLVAPVDAFQLVARHLSGAHFRRFKAAFIEVFGRIDPKIEMGENQHIFHAEDGTHSNWLRSGLAETLLLISERGHDARIALDNPKDFANEVIGAVPGLGNSWKLLASIRDQFAKLAEAAPRPLLDSLERQLGANPQDFARLFEERNGVFSESWHTGLLWGLETLAWDPQYLSRVAIILAKLASLDPGGQLTNRPINSLREIFLWWHPGTNASVSHKLSVIDQILSGFPDIGWALLEKMLPRWMDSASFPTNTPRWRDCGELPEEMRTRRGQFHYMGELVNRAIDRLSLCPERWHAVLDTLSVLSASQADHVIERFRDLARSEMSQETRLALWTTLRDFTARHRAYQDTEWALRQDRLDELEAVQGALAPADPVARHCWLFDEMLPDLPGGYDDIEESQRRADKMRKDAALEIISSVGVDGLVRLGTSCNMPGLVAAAAIANIADVGMLSNLVGQAIACGDQGVLLAAQFSGQGFERFGDRWQEYVRGQALNGVWAPPLAGALLAWWPDDRRTWDFVETLGEDIVREYWKKKPLFLIKGNEEDQTYQVNRLLWSGRAIEAFDRLALHGAEMPTPELLQVFDATVDALAHMETEEEARRLPIRSYDIERYLDQLRSRSELPREEVARREYSVLPLLSYGYARGLTLHDLMAESPAFFVDVLCDVFRPANRDKSQDELASPEARARAKAAYRVLEGMERLPGQVDENGIDRDILMAWIQSARDLAAQKDRAAVCDIKIGDILAHAPSDPDDGAWPHRVVRSVIDELTSTDIDRGMMVERFNMRGPTWRAVHEGGVQERALAAQYRGWAEASRMQWPRMASVLEAIAKDWERQAVEEDLRAEQDRLNLG